MLQNFVFVRHTYQNRTIVYPINVLEIVWNGVYASGWKFNQIFYAIKYALRLIHL